MTTLMICHLYLSIQRSCELWERRLYYLFSKGIIIRINTVVCYSCFNGTDQETYSIQLQWLKLYYVLDWWGMYIWWIHPRINISRFHWVFNFHRLEFFFKYQLVGALMLHYQLDHSGAFMLGIDHKCILYL